MLTRVRLLERTPFEAALAFAAVCGALAYIIDPGAVQKTAIGHTARILLPYWTALYGIGGLGMLVGLFLCSARVEVAGCLALTAALIINAIAIVNFVGTQGIISFMTFVALALACLARANLLYGAYRRQEP